LLVILIKPFLYEILSLKNGFKKNNNLFGIIGISFEKNLAFRVMRFMLSPEEYNF
jgi:hypothetical protein